jgi:hypothetical protein
MKATVNESEVQSDESMEVEAEGTEQEDAETDCGEGDESTDILCVPYPTIPFSCKVVSLNDM